MEIYLKEKFGVDQVKSELENPDSGFYFADVDNSIVGYLKVNKGNAQTETLTDKAIEIERIYVLREFHGKQIGQLLYNKALEIAQLNSANFLWLGVWEKNARAIRFYAKNGFVKFDKHVFKLGNDSQTDILMKLELHKDE